MLESESGYCPGKAYIWIWVSYTNSPTFLSWVCFSSVIAEDIFDSRQNPMCHTSFTSFLLLSCQRVEVLEMLCAHCASPASWCSDKSLRQRHCVPDVLHLTPPTSFVSPWCHMGTESILEPLFIQWPYFSKESTTGFPLSPAKGMPPNLGVLCVPFEI